MDEQIKEKLECYLPFYGFADLYGKCEQILQILNDYQKESSQRLAEMGIEFGGMKFGHFINVENLNEDQKKQVMGNPAWQVFYKTFAEKFKIVDKNNVLQIG